jgi:HD superfamily phosphohydrolase
LAGGIQKRDGVKINYMAILKYNDRVYGQIKIEEPIIIELIKTRALQRLKGVDQAGYFEPYFPGSRHSRFEHSLGDWWLLKNIWRFFRRANCRVNS